MSGEDILEEAMVDVTVEALSASTLSDNLSDIVADAPGPDRSGKQVSAFMGAFGW